MTKNTNFTLPMLEQFLLGIQPNFFDGTLSRQDSFPRYNIFEELNEEGTPVSVCVEIALAGYNADDLQVIVDKGVLSVGTRENFKLDQKNNAPSSVKVIHQGITKRSFKTNFNLTPQLSETPQVTFKDGMLLIKFEYLRPNKKTIPILTQ